MSIRLCFYTKLVFLHLVFSLGSGIMWCDMCIHVKPAGQLSEGVGGNQHRVLIWPVLKRHQAQQQHSSCEGIERKDCFHNADPLSSGCSYEKHWSCLWKTCDEVCWRITEPASVDRADWIPSSWAVTSWWLKMVKKKKTHSVCCNQTTNQAAVFSTANF